MLRSDEHCQVDTMREYHTEYSITSKTVQDRQCGKMDELFCPTVPQQYKDKSLTDLIDLQDQELRKIDLVDSTDMLAEENKEVDRASLRGHIQSTLKMTEAVTQARQIQEQCKEVSTREKCDPVTTGESKTILYREQCHNITKGWMTQA